MAWSYERIAPIPDVQNSFHIIPNYFIRHQMIIIHQMVLYRRPMKTLTSERNDGVGSQDQMGLCLQSYEMV